MIAKVGDLMRHIGDVSDMETITVTTFTWKPGFKLISALSMRPRTVPASLIGDVGDIIPDVPVSVTCSRCVPEPASATRHLLSLL